VTVINNFVFVHERDFCSHSVRRHFVRHDRLSERVRHEWRERDFRRPPRQDRIERVSHDAVTRLDGRPRQTLAPQRDRRLGRPDVRPDLTGARRGRDGRDETRRESGETEGRAISRPAWGGDDERRQPGRRDREHGSRFDGDDGPTGRQPSGGWIGRSHVERRPEREPRVRGPRLDSDDSPLRPHAWGGHGSDQDVRRAPDDAGPRKGGSEPRHSAGHHGDGAARMGLAPGVR